jgi:2'-5' RNA ligase
MKLDNSTLNTLLGENTTPAYEYGCVMLYFDFPQMSEIHSLIDERDVYTQIGDATHGLEKIPHCTLLYGLHYEVPLDGVREVLDEYLFYTCKVHNPSLFQTERYDVLKFDVCGANLYDVNDSLKEFPHTTAFSVYNPHMTIGYIKSGRGRLYENRLKRKGFDEFWLQPTHAVYSQPDGTKTMINITVL